MMAIETRNIIPPNPWIRRVTLAGVLFCLLFLYQQTAVTVVAADVSCPDIRANLAVASRSGAVDEAVHLYRMAEKSGVCSGPEVVRLGRLTAFAFYLRAYEDDVTEKQRESDLRTALRFGRPWQVLAAYADGIKASRNYAKAAKLYQEAMDDIADVNLNPTPPARGVIASIYKKASVARMLARSYVASTERGGKPGGLALANIRGFTVETTPIPIHFEYNKVDFTADGKKAADDMLAYLTREGSPSIDLVGHTDPKGSASYNQKLSERRAAAVKSYLVDKGYKGAIRAIGRGESEPFEADEPESYSVEEMNQLHRRVELLRK